MNKKVIFFVFAILLIRFVSCADFNEEMITNKVSEVGGEITKDIEFSDGNLVKAEIQFGEKEVEIGKFISKDLDEGNFVASNMQYQKDKSVNIFTYNQVGGKLKIGEDNFENIKPQCTDELKNNNLTCSGQPTYIKLDENGEITKADFTTNEKGGTYVFNGTKIFVPANSRVTYDKENGISIEINDGEIKELPKIKEGYEGLMQQIKINGNNVKLPEGHVLQEGELNYDGEKFYVSRNKEAIIDTVKFHKVNNDVGIYFDEDFNTAEHQLENYYFSDGKEIIIQSNSDGGEVVVEYLAGDDFFNMKTKNGNIIADDKDFFKISVKNGGFISAEKKDGKLPLLQQTNVGDGETIIENGRYTCSLKEEFRCDKKLYKTQKNFDEITSGKYQSVKFELESDSISEGYKVRFGCNNQFVFVDDRSNEKVSYNKYGIGINNDAECGVQTLDDLNEKWKSRGIKFGIEKYEGAYSFVSENYKEVTPYMIQSVDQWLEENPDQEMDYISFSDVDNAAFSPQRGNRRGIVLGERIFDPETVEKFSFSQIDRNFKSPLSIITHEYEHLMDDVILNKDYNSLEELYSLIRSDYKYKSLFESAKEHAEGIVDENNLGEIQYFETGIGGGYPEDLIEEDKQNYISSKDYLEKNGYESFINKYKNYLDNSKLTKEGVDEYIASKRELYKDGLLTNRISEEYSNLKNEGISEEEIMKKLLQNQEYNSFIKTKVVQLRRNSAERKFVSEQILEETKFKPLQKFYGEIVQEKNIELQNDKYFKNIYYNAINLLETEKDKFSPNLKTVAGRYIDRSKNGESYNLEIISAMAIFSEESQLISEKYQEIANYIEKEKGLPALYAFRDYGEDKYDLYNDLIYNADGLKELSTTYREESIEERKQKLNGGTKGQQEVYYKMTQLAFDSGKMSISEYKNLMGEDYCKDENCNDKKCVLYKLNCEKILK